MHDTTPGSAAERPRVRKLDPRVISQIAAGEMILRPFSVVKELIENALDAGAGRIEVALGEAPDHWLEVSDDGIGMGIQDLGLALEAHATSKLAEESDLLSVKTLGFRGEALPSIGRVARLDIRTFDGESGSGCRAVVEGGNLIKEEPCARARGTTVRVEDLFFNSPVRKRFLKGSQGEVRLITRLVTVTAMAFPHVTFRMTHRGEGVLDLKAVPGLAERLAQIHGPDFEARLLPLVASGGRGSISGFVGVPEIARPGTQHQVLLVNQRWVTAPWVSAALRHGFGDLVPAHRNPFAIVLLNLDPSRVDVNVHPTKREVRFLDEAALFSDLVRAVRAPVARLVPTWNLDAGDATGYTPATANEPGSQLRLGRQEILPLLHGIPPAREVPAPGPLIESREADRVAEAPLAEAPARSLVPLWQLHNRYLFAQTRQGLLIVDQHAAHERVLYEQALVHLDTTPAPTQQLLFPAVVQVLPEEWAAFRALHDDLRRLGVDSDEFGQHTVLLRGVPALWTRDPEGIFREVLAELTQKGSRGNEERRRMLAASFACRSAIKSGQALGLEEMNALIDQLFATQVPHGDPHGRPTFIQVGLKDLDRRFGRH